MRKQYHFCPPTTWAAPRTSCRTEVATGPPADRLGLVASDLSFEAAAGGDRAFHGRVDVGDDEIQVDRRREPGRRRRS